ncbi:MAG: hypothetical protein M3Z25_13030 [Actinomycetota bacterium]|nr:hypothetical protein [Actinomycetota bacterium]
MLKTLGVVVAATAALLVATTPLAYADDADDNGNISNTTHQENGSTCNKGTDSGQVVGDAKGSYHGGSGSCSQDNTVRTSHKKKRSPDAPAGGHVSAGDTRISRYGHND